MVCHAFLLITFAFSSYSRSVEACNCCSDWRETGTQIGQIGKTENHIRYQIWKPISIFYENWKPNAKKWKIQKPKWTVKPKNWSFWHKNRKTDLKNSLNHKTENPNAPLLNAYVCTLENIIKLTSFAYYSLIYEIFIDCGSYFSYFVEMERYIRDCIVRKWRTLHLSYM